MFFKGKKLLLFLFSFGLFTFASTPSFANMKKTKWTKAKLSAFFKKAEADFVHKDLHVRNATQTILRLDALKPHLESAKDDKSLLKVSGSLEKEMTHLKMGKTAFFLKLRKTHQALSGYDVKVKKAQADVKKAKAVFDRVAAKHKKKKKRYKLILSRMKKMKKLQMKFQKKQTVKQHGKVGVGMRLQIKKTKKSIKEVKLKKSLRKLEKIHLRIKTDFSASEDDYKKAKAAYLKSQRVFGWIKKTAKKVAKGVKKAAKKAWNGTKKAAKKVAEAAKKAAQKAFKFLKEKIKKAAKRAWAKIKKKFQDKVLRKIVRKLMTVMKKARKHMKSEFGKNLKNALKKIKQPGGKEKVRKLIREYKGKVNKLRAYGKAAMKGAALAILMQALTVTHTCYPYAGEKKRQCLAKDIGRSFRDGIYYIALALVMAAIDVALIEPLSHSAAGVCSTAIASVTAGIGFAVYPIVYVIVSAGMNLLVYFVAEKFLRPEYNKLYRKTLAKHTDKAAKDIAKSLKGDWISCWRPDKKCDSGSKSTKSKKKKVARKPKSRTTKSKGKSTSRKPKKRTKKLIFVYKGCFKDKRKRDLPRQIKGSRFTPTTCASRCRALKYKYAGVQYHGQCFCGKKYGRYGRGRQCKTRCKANKRKNCGGTYHNSIYRVR